VNIGKEQREFRDKLQVSVVEPSGNLYGSELALLDILEGLNSAVFRSEVILPYGTPFAAKLSKLGVANLCLLPPDMLHRSKVSKAWNYLRLAWHWRCAKPDLVYINQGGILRPVSGIARWLKLPMLCQVQTAEDAHWISSLPSIHAQVSTFVCNSNFIAQLTRVPVGRLSTIYQGYKFKGLQRPRHRTRTPSEPIVVGLLGRVCRGKGHDLVVEAAGRLRRLGVNRFRFRFIGNATEPEEQRLIDGLVAQHGVRDLIEFRGFREDIGAELAALDLLAIPSVAEPFGRILCEAAEAQVPVLLADSGGLGELSRRFDIGVRFEAKQVEDFLRQLLVVADNYDEVRRCFLASAERLLGALDLREYIGVMSQLITQAAASRAVSLEWLGKGVSRT
jgi:glycosyltransferase involved in cell wall biosynthesis